MLLWCICVILESSSPTVFAEKSTHFLLLCFTEEIQVSKKTGFKEKSTSVQLKVKSFRSSCRILWDWQCLASLGLAMEQKLMSCLVCSSSKKRKTGYVGALPTLSLSLNTHHLSAVRLHSSTRARDAETDLTAPHIKEPDSRYPSATTPLHPLHVSWRQTWPCVFVLVSGNWF